jgi:hypothetical protein
MTANWLRAARRFASIVCFFLAVYMALGSRAWDYAFAFSDPITDFVAAAINVLILLCLRDVTVSAAILGACLAGAVQILADRFLGAPGWPEAIYAPTALSLTIRIADRAQPSAPPRFLRALVLLPLAASVKGLSGYVVPYVPPAWLTGTVYPFYFMLTWGLAVLALSQLAGVGTHYLGRRMRTASGSQTPGTMP